MVTISRATKVGRAPSVDGTAGVAETGGVCGEPRIELRALSTLVEAGKALLAIRGAKLYRKTVRRLIRDGAARYNDGR